MAPEARNQLTTALGESAQHARLERPRGAWPVHVNVNQVFKYFITCPQLYEETAKSLVLKLAFLILP